MYTVCPASMLSRFSCVWLFVTTWTVACQAPLSMEFSRLGYWSGLPCPPPGDLPDPGLEPVSLASPALQAGSFPTEPPGSPLFVVHSYLKYHLSRIYCLPTVYLRHIGRVSVFLVWRTDWQYIMWHINCCLRVLTHKSWKNTGRRKGINSSDIKVCDLGNNCSVLSVSSVLYH